MSAKIEDALQRASLSGSPAPDPADTVGSVTYIPSAPLVFDDNAAPDPAEAMDAMEAERLQTFKSTLARQGEEMARTIDPAEAVRAKCEAIAREEEVANHSVNGTRSAHQIRTRIHSR